MVYPKDQLSVPCYFCCILMTYHLPSIAPLRLFADDTCLVVDGSNESSLKSKMNIDLSKLTRWLNANKLTINPSKSIILIILPKTNQPTPTIELHVNNLLIPASCLLCISSPGSFVWTTSHGINLSIKPEKTCQSPKQSSKNDWWR